MRYLHKRVTFLVPAAVWLLATSAFAQSGGAARPVESASSPEELRLQRERHSVELDKMRSETRKLDAEIEKIQLELRDLTPGADPKSKRDVEVAKITAEREGVAPWWGSMLSAFLGTIVGFIGVIVTGWLAWGQAKNSRISTFDMKLIELRLANYGKLVAATEPLALYGSTHRVVNQSDCLNVANGLKEQYFGLTGILLTHASQKRYLSLTNALMRASVAAELKVPRTEEQWVECWKSLQSTRRAVLRVGTEYPTTQEMTQKDLEKKADSEIKAVSDHVFGQSGHVYADFVVLNFAASRFRTALINDIRSRRVPEDLKALGGPD